VKTPYIITAVAVVGILVFVFTRDPEGSHKTERLAAQAAARGEFQFVGIMWEDGKKLPPSIPGVPDWYLQKAGVNYVQADASTDQAALLRRTKTYNDALYRQLKVQGKFHFLEENIERVRNELAPLQKPEASPKN